MGDIVVAGHQTGDEAINGIVTGNGVFIGVNQTGGAADFIGQAHIFFHNDDVAVAFLYSLIGHGDQSFGFAGTLVSYD